MSLLEKLSINKKITAFFADGSQKMNLGIAAVVDLLNGTEKVRVQIAPVKRAERLLADLAESAGRTVAHAPEGVFLVQPGVEVSEPEAATEAVSDPEPVEVIAQSEPEIEPVAEVQPLAEVQPKPVKKAKVDRKYATLSKIFFNGSPMGQVLSIFKTRESNPQKVEDYKSALANGDCRLPEGPFTKSVAEKMKALGFNVLE